MLKLFNGHNGVIKVIRNYEVKELVDIANKYGLDLMYPNMFKDVKDKVYDIGIDDKYLGGYLSLICYMHEYVLTNPNKLYVFKTVEDLKDYLRMAEAREESFFLTEEDIDKYSKYLDKLSSVELEREYHYVKWLMIWADCNYSSIKNVIKVIVEDMKYDCDRKNLSLDNIKSYLERLSDLITELEEINYIQVYCINKDNCFKKDIDVKDIKEYLRSTHQAVHSGDKGPFYLRTIEKNLTIIYHIFNYKLLREGKVSYKHHAYNVLREIGLTDGIPDYLVGKKNDGTWDYEMVLRRFIYTLEIFDYNPIRSNKKILLATKSIEKAQEVVDKLMPLGYSKDSHFSIGCDIVGVIVDPHEKTIGTSSSGTIMACMCSAYDITGLKIDLFLSNIDKIITNYDFVYYNKLLKRDRVFMRVDKRLVTIMETLIGIERKKK